MALPISLFLSFVVQLWKNSVIKLSRARSEASSVSCEQDRKIKKIERKWKREEKSEKVRGNILKMQLQPEKKCNAMYIAWLLQA